VFHIALSAKISFLKTALSRRFAKKATSTSVSLSMRISFLRRENTRYGAFDKHASDRPKNYSSTLQLVLALSFPDSTHSRTYFRPFRFDGLIDSPALSWCASKPT